jgi:4-amino-4-deoxy-L-arabinose transferase-like glycosyltransferase
LFVHDRRNMSGVVPDAGASASRAQASSPLLLVLVLLAARLAYNASLSPYELVADEAQYWDWSRHLDLSYYSKGPGIALSIAAATRVLGTSAAAVRLPAALAVTVAAWGFATLATRLAEGRRDFVGLVAVVLFASQPAVQLLSLLSTIDAPLVACWLLAALLGWRVLGARARSGALAWAALGLVIGIGFLFKYAMLLLVPGLALFAFIARRERLREPETRSRIALAACVMLVVASPVVIWNIQHRAAGLAHLLGYVGAPFGDRAVEPPGFVRFWGPLELAGLAVGILGPAAVLSLLEIRMALGERARRPEAWDACIFSISVALPMLLFYLVVSFRTRLEGNWPLAALLTLLLPAASFAAREGRPARLWTRICVAYGFAALLVIHLPLLAAGLPILGRLVPVHRFKGFAAVASSAAAPLAELRSRTGREPFVVAATYGDAALLAFYAPGHPVATSAASLLGDRPSSYDVFPDTDLRSERLKGRPALLLGGTPETWSAVLGFDRVEASPDPRFVLGFGYRGPAAPRGST